MNMNNSVLNLSNNLYSQKSPGIYMILCSLNNFRYYGETGNLGGRFRSHKSRLRRNIHSNNLLQKEWNLYGESFFDFVVLYNGEDWNLRETRRTMESRLINQNSERSYNFYESFSQRYGSLNPFHGKNHSEKTKKR